MEVIRFYNPTRGNLSFEETILEVVGFILEDPDSDYKISIGTDSASSEYPEFATAVTVHRVGKGGRFFITKFLDRTKKFKTIRERIYQETMLSLNIAMLVWQGIEDKLQTIYPIRDDIKEDESQKICPISRDDINIHLDIGNQGVTREMIGAMEGMVKGNGFEAEIKPRAYAASTVAHEYT